MKKSSKELLEESENLNRENEILRQQIRDVKIYFDAITNEKIDAVVVPNEKDLKVYTEITADRSYRILIEKMHEGAVTLNKGGNILYCNSAFAHMVNLPLQKVIGTMFDNFFDDSSKENIEILLKQGILNTLNEEGFLKTVDGRKVPVLITVNALTLDNSFVLSIILTDMSVQNENQEKLRLRTDEVELKNSELIKINKELDFQIEEKEKRVAELSIAKTEVKDLTGLNSHKESILATLSHDLRSPLTGMIQMLELLKENFETLELSEIKEMLDIIYSSSTDELSMLDYLVEWARVKYASEAFSPENIELDRYVKKTFDTLNDCAIANNIHLHNEVEGKISVFADGKMLQSILQNIISNAIKHTPPGGNVTVSAKRQEEVILIEIRDSGLGMSREETEKLFTPQMLTLSKARGKNKGAGIGLLLVKGFLEKNGGEIWVNSTEGLGTSFYFRLPAEKTNGTEQHLQYQNQIKRSENSNRLVI
jgi:PAS domain S-box-containing protein